MARSLDGTTADREPLDRGAQGTAPSDVLHDCYMWCPYVVGLVVKSHPVYTDDDGKCPTYEEE